ncbi:MAG TPA: LysR substrate-binding domain-containing protein [Usitatibacter sp.]|nr:LysR substrate-binding domain-containing protein [Usitatibacter sp.]
MKHITRRQLRAFAAVVAQQGFSGAAKVLHLTQPAISLQVKELERSCGLALLERSGRRIRPTEAGRELLRAAQAVERELRGAEDALSALKGLRGGLLTVAVISTAQYFAPRLLSEFCRRHPDVKLRLDVCNRAAMLRHLEEDDIDIAIMGRPPEEIEARAEPFAPNPHVVVAAPGHRLATRRRIALRELLEEPFIAREPGSGTRILADGLFAKHRVPFAPALVMSSNEAIKQAVMAGMAISFLSLHTVGREVAGKTMRVLDVEDLPIVRRWYLVHRAEKRLSPAAAAFRDFILGEAGAIVDEMMAPAIAAAKLVHRRLPTR